MLLMVLDLVAVGYGVCCPRNRSLPYKCKHFLAFPAYIVYQDASKWTAEEALENSVRWVQVVPSLGAASIFRVNGYFSHWSIYNYCLLLLGLHPSAMLLSLCGGAPCYPDGEKHALKSATAIIGHTEKFTLPAPLHYLWSPMLEIPFDRNNQRALGIFQPRKDANIVLEEGDLPVLNSNLDGGTCAGKLEQREKV